MFAYMSLIFNMMTPATILLIMGLFVYTLLNILYRGSIFAYQFADVQDYTELKELKYASVSFAAAGALIYMVT